MGANQPNNSCVVLEDSLCDYEVILLMLNISMWMSSADDMPKLSTFSKKFKLKFSLAYLDKHEECIKMSTNKPSIGPVVLEITT